MSREAVLEAMNLKHELQPKLHFRISMMSTLLPTLNAPGHTNLH